MIGTCGQRWLEEGEPRRERERVVLLAEMAGGLLCLFCAA